METNKKYKNAKKWIVVGNKSLIYSKRVKIPYITQ